MLRLIRQNDKHKTEQYNILPSQTKARVRGIWGKSRSNQTEGLLTMTAQNALRSLSTWLPIVQGAFAQAQYFRNAALRHPSVAWQGEQREASARGGKRSWLGSAFTNIFDTRMHTKRGPQHNSTRYIYKVQLYRTHINCSLWLCRGLQQSPHERSLSCDRPRVTQVSDGV